MADLLTLEHAFTLMMLVFLQAVLGFDNLLYISLESKRVAPERRQFVRRIGIGLAIALRIVMLFVVMALISSFEAPFWTLHLPPVIEADFNVQSVVTLGGGVFIMHTAVKEISHLLSIDDLDHAHEQENGKRSEGMAIFMIVLMNLVFSFDSILSAIALTDEMVVMAIAIVASGIMMMVLADEVSRFLERNRMYEVLGLFILLIVGVMLLSEGGHVGHLKLFGVAIEPLSKSTFYFSVIVLVLVDVAQSRYQAKLDLQRGRTPDAASGQPTA